MRPSLSILSLLAVAAGLVACSVREERVVQPTPSTATVVAPAPTNVVYTDTAPARTTTTVYTR